MVTGEERHMTTAIDSITTLRMYLVLTSSTAHSEYHMQAMDYLDSLEGLAEENHALKESVIRLGQELDRANLIVYEVQSKQWETKQKDELLEKRTKLEEQETLNEEEIKVLLQPTSYGGLSKVTCIKMYRDRTHQGLRESKERVDLYCYDHQLVG
jgi:exonuclease III